MAHTQGSEGDSVVYKSATAEHRAVLVSRNFGSEFSVADSTREIALSEAGPDLAEGREVQEVDQQGGSNLASAAGRLC